MDILILLGGFAVLCAIGMPVAYALGFAAILAALYVEIPLEAVMLKISDGTDDFALLAIPFFVLAGAIMAEGGMAMRLINLAKVFVGVHPRRARAREHPREHAVRLHFGLVGGRHCVDRLSDDSADGEARVSEGVRHQRHHLRLGPGADDPAIAQRGDLLACRGRHDLGRALVPGGRVPRPAVRALPDRARPLDRAQARLPEGRAGAAAQTCRASRSKHSGA